MSKKTKSKPSTKRKPSTRRKGTLNSSSNNLSNNSLNNIISKLDMTDCLLVIIVILVIYYLLTNNSNSSEGYTNNIKKNNTNNTNNNNNNTNNSKPTMMLFHAKWCGHCVRFMPEWKKFKEQAKINVIEYEADDNSKDISENNVKGFPTIKCRTSSGDVKEFNGDRTVDGLNAFAEECSK
jgi:thiol-disulfide isomerase/thioredoxin